MVVLITTEQAVATDQAPPYISFDKKVHSFEQKNPYIVKGKLIESVLNLATIFWILNIK